jgi:ribosomal protein S6-L-glutamate ligase RimK-like protein
VLTMLWGLESDAPLAAVSQALSGLGGETLLIDQRRVLETGIQWGEGARLTGHIRYQDRCVALEEISACYVRPYDTRRIPAIEQAGPGSHEWLHALRLEDGLLDWLETTAARVVNRPSAMLANGCKPYQLELVRLEGFSIPDTLVTTDPEVAAEFLALHGQVIYKSISGVRSRVSRLLPGDHGRLKDLVHCPTQFQQYIPGCDYRVHVVGQSVFSCEIVSDADDYRYGAADGAPQIWAARLPREVEDRAVRMTRNMGLEISGIDLRRTPGGEWYCFEVNPSPGFTFFEQFAGQNLATSIARHLFEA